MEAYPSLSPSRPDPFKCRRTFRGLKPITNNIKFRQGLKKFNPILQFIIPTTNCYIYVVHFTIVVFIDEIR